MKKLTALLLTMALLLSLLPAGIAEVRAAGTTVSYAVEGGNIYFDTSTGTVTGCDPDITVANIPSDIEGVPVTAIGDSAFESCEALTSITIPDSVTTIGNFAFSYCYALTSITIPNSVTTIGNHAFFACLYLTSITLGDVVTSIGDSAFSYCFGLRSIWVQEGNEVYSSDANGILFSKDKTQLLQCPGGYYGAYIIPDSVTTIGDSAFSGCCTLTAVTIPDSVTTIGYSAFSGCEALTDVTIPDSVTTIGDSAFSYCYNLTSITIANSVTTFGNYTFYYCEALTSITIPDSVTTIGDYVFYCCDRLTDVYYFGTEAQWSNITIRDGNEALQNATIHYNVRPGSTGSPEDPTDPTPVVDKSIQISHTLNLASDIAISYVIVADSLSEYDSYYMECVTPVYEGNTLVGSTTHILEPELRGSYYYFILDGLTSLEMNDTVEARLYMTKAGKSYTSEPDHYSVATYAYNKLNNSATAQDLKTVCANLLQYGSKAQLYKEYRTDALPDGEMTAEHRSYLTDPTSVAFGNNKSFLGDHSAPTVTFVGAPLRLDSKIIVRYVIDTTAYKGNMEDLSLRVSYEGIDGSIVTETLTDLELYYEAASYYAFDFDGLLASELRTVMSAVVYEGDTPVSETMTYSVDTYGNGRTGSLLTLIQAMMAYSDSCKVYFE